MFFCVGIQVLSICGIWFVLWRRNAKRGQILGGEQSSTEGYEMGFRDMTDKENIHFRVSSTQSFDLRRQLTLQNSMFTRRATLSR